MISEIENFEGKPNLKEFDFCALGQRFKFSSWYDVTTYEGVAKIEQNGVLLAHDEEFVFVDLRKPVFDLVVYIDQQKHQLQIFVFGLLSVQVQCRVDDAVVFGPKRLPAYALIIAPLSALASNLLKKHLRRSKQKGENSHTDMPTATPRVKHKTKPLIRKIIKPVAAIALPFSAPLALCTLLLGIAVRISHGPWPVVRRKCDASPVGWPSANAVDGARNFLGGLRPAWEWC